MQVHVQTKIHEFMFAYLCVSVFVCVSAVAYVYTLLCFYINSEIYIQTNACT